MKLTRDKLIGVLTNEKLARDKVIEELTIEKTNEK